MWRYSLLVACAVALPGCGGTPAAKNPGTTATDQKENKADVDRTAEIRKRVVDAKLSTSATNVTIVTRDGGVTLTGTVKSAEEKAKVEDIAKEVAGTSSITSHLEVKP